uniref:Uncharacterized protein n=1 Tax=Sander lucioperca TaxID=283035 RepID=A0A8C9XRP5_SANLU
MMKLWFPARPLSPHLPRRKLWLTHSKYSCQWCIFLFYLHLLTHWPRPILWLLPLQRDMKYWSYPTSFSYNNRFCRICPTLRTNIILRCHRHY